MTAGDESQPGDGGPLVHDPGCPCLPADHVSYETALEKLTVNLILPYEDLIAALTRFEGDPERIADHFVCAPDLVRERLQEMQKCRTCAATIAAAIRRGTNRLGRLEA